MVWETAADAISQYRDRYAIPDDDPRPLGPTPKPGRFRQRHEHGQVADYLTTTARRLDRPPVELDGSVLPETDRGRLADERNRDVGYEP